MRCSAATTCRTGTQRIAAGISAPTGAAASGILVAWWKREAVYVRTGWLLATLTRRSEANLSSVSQTLLRCESAGDLVWSHSEHHLYNVYNEAVLAPRFAASCTPAQITTAPAAPLSSFARVVTS